MQAIDFSESIIQAVGWTVLHSLWQGAILLVVLLVLQQQLRQSSSNFKYWLAYGTLMLQLVLSVGTFAYLYEPAPTYSSIKVLAMTQLSAGLEVTPEVVNATSGSYLLTLLENNLDLIAACWLLGMCIFLLRMFVGLLYLRQLRSSRLPLGEEWTDSLTRLAGQLGIRRKMQIGASAKVDSPLILGQLRPLILLPIAMINQLNPAQVEAILAHELAHLRRYDYWFNLLQSFIEAVFYYHPAIWMISQRIRTEREHCCDDIAVQVCGDDLLYASTLYAVETLRRPTHQPKLALAFGGSQKNSLLDRVNRIITSNYQQPNTMEKFTITGLVLGAALLFTLTVSWTDADPMQILENDIEIAVDTLPQGKMRMRTTHKGQRIETEVKDGAIKKLVIDGKTIPASEYAKYESLVEEVIENMPPPPPPPPAPPVPGAPPAPPAPPAPNAPPAPPAPDGARKVIINKDGSKEVIIIRSGDEDQYYWEDDEDGDGQHSYFFSTDDMDGNDFIFLSDSTMKVALNGVGHTLDNLPEILEMAFSSLQGKDGEMHAFKLQMDSLRLELDSDDFKIHMQEAKEALKGMDIQISHLNEALNAKMIEIEIENDGQDADTRIYAGGKRIKLVEKLKEDGLIKDAQNFKIQFSNKELKVDGKKMSSQVHQQYVDWYEAQTGKKMSESMNLNINVNNN